MRFFKPSIAPYLVAIARESDDLLPPYITSDLSPKAEPKPSLPVVETPEEPMTATPSKLPDTIQSAALKKVEVEMKPILDKVSMVRTCLDSYERTARLETERGVTNAVMTALGMDPLPGIEGADESRAALRTSLTALLNLVGGAVPFEVPSSVVEIKVQPAAAQTPEPLVVVPTPASPPAPKPEPRKLDPEDVAKARALVDEIESLSGTIRDQDHARFFPLLQALVAEARLLMDRLPPSNGMYDRLSQIMPVLGAMKNESGLPDFVKGLAFGATGDWASIATVARRRVAQYDADALHVKAPPSESESKASQKRVSGAKLSPHEWPKLPSLRHAIRSKPVVIVGGLVVPEKIDLCVQRFGIRPEWHETQKDADRTADSIAARIRAGGSTVPCGIILLEGLMGHKMSSKVIEACKAKKVPFILADKGGTASLETAFNTLDTKLAG